MTGEGKVKDDDKKKKGKLDPVGQEDKDIDNDGDYDKTDKYLLHVKKKLKLVSQNMKFPIRI